MPYDERGLTMLSSADAFTLWHYRTNDARALVVLPGYFAPAGSRLNIGDVIIVQAADSTSFVPVGVSATAGTGITLSNSGPGLRLVRSATQPITVTQSAAAIVRALVPDALPASALPGSEITLNIAVIGPIAQVAVSVIDQAGQPTGVAQIIPVVGGNATVTVTLPGPAGRQWRLRVSDAADPTLSVTSPPTLIREFARILTEAGGRLLLENGAVLLA